jgi:hypothetical protein
MSHLLAFLGPIGVAVIVATSPLLLRIFEYLFSVAEKDGPPAKTASSRSAEPSAQSMDRLEIRDEIRRLTAALESDRPRPLG